MSRSLVLVIALVASCSSKGPATPAVSETRKDLDVFCSPEAAAKTDSMADLGPYVEPKIHSPEITGLLQDIKGGKISIDEFNTKMRAQLTANHVDSCPTLDRLMSPRPVG